MKRIQLSLSLLLMLTLQIGITSLASIKHITMQHYAPQRVSLDAGSQPQRYNQQKKREAKLHEFVKKLERLMLGTQNYSFDPAVLLLPPSESKERLKAVVARTGQADTMLRPGAPSTDETSIGKLTIADTVYLPGNVELPGETLILANNVVLEKEVSFISGSHDLYMIVNESMSTLSGTSAAPKLRIELRSSSKSASLRGDPRVRYEPVRSVRGLAYSRPSSPPLANRGGVQLLPASMKRNHNLLSLHVSLFQQGMPGSSGQAGASGFDGSNGGQGDCSVNNGNGGNGDNGAAASEGTAGGTGENGGRGSNGPSFFFYDPNPQACNSYNISVWSYGGNGGNGGDGGTGGAGGNGGNGGTGGNGANCSCLLYGHGGGNGGTGGNGGMGAKGGNGGSAGNGGDGGDGGSLYVFTSDCSAAYSNYYLDSEPGYGGIGGYGGSPGPSGVNGSGGSGGQAGLGMGSGCPNGIGGTSGAPPASGPGSAISGTPGSWGNSGQQGYVFIFTY